MGGLGAEQLSWLKKDVASLSSSTPIVVFAHIPLWMVYPEWGWGTKDGAEALSYLKRFGSVTVLNGHIHQVVQKVEGNVSFHTATSTASPNPPRQGSQRGTDDGSCWEVEELSRRHRGQVHWQARPACDHRFLPGGKSMRWVRGGRIHLCACFGGLAPAVSRSPIRGRGLGRSEGPASADRGARFHTPRRPRDPHHKVCRLPLHADTLANLWPLRTDLVAHGARHPRRPRAHEPLTVGHLLGGPAADPRSEDRTGDEAAQHAAAAVSNDPLGCTHHQRRCAGLQRMGARIVRAGGPHRAGHRRQRSRPRRGAL